MAWGYHLLLDLKNCKSISDITIEKFVIELLPKIKMNPVGVPHIEYLLPKTPNAGYSMVQMIQTSNLTAHFVDATREGYVDLFSCKQFDQQIVIDVATKCFQPESIKHTFLERQA
jgi:S-adenosylmethionine/arginine decarboxylase-like enzyme